MKVLNYTETTKEDWNNLVKNSPEGWLYQTSRWIDYAQKCGSESRSFGIFSDENILLAVCPLYLKGKNSRLHFRTLHTGYSGPALSSALGVKHRKKVWKYLFEHIDKIANEEHADSLQVRMTSIAPAFLPPHRKEINPLWTVGIINPMPTYNPKLTTIIDLRKSTEELLSEMDMDCRAAIKQAERFGLAFRVSNSREDVIDYYKIHNTSWERTGLTPHELNYFYDMWDTFHPDANLKILFAEYQNVPVAGIIIHLYKNAVFYWGGCSLPEALKLRANNYLLWSAMQYSKENSFDWFEIGQTYPYCNQKEIKEYHIGRYKTQFGGSSFVPFEGEKIYSLKLRVKRLLKNFREK